MSSLLLQADTVSRRYGGLTALDNVSLAVPAGARHAVIGANGAGKTTLFHCVAGTIRPSSGRILLDGNDVTRLGPAARARRGIGRTFQHPAVVGGLTVAANLALAVTWWAPAGVRSRMLARSTRPSVRSGTVDAALDAAGLTAYATVRAGDLSYGLRRRVELATALAARPRLLLLDEPSAGLDPDEITQLTATLRALPADMAVLLIDHHLDLVWAVADTVTVLHHGRHITTGPPAAVRTDPAVHAAYLTPPAARHQPPAALGSAAPTSHPRGRAAGWPVATPVLQVQALRVGYHGAAVLHDVDLDVPAGTVVAVLGRNGAGKSTLLNTIAGLQPRHPGSRIDLDGRPLPARPEQAAHAGVAIVPQGRRLVPGLTVAEHLTLAAAARRPHTARRWDRDDLLTLLPPLAARLGHPAARLSGGEQQMLALARALAGGPRLLLLDEPAEGLAPAIVEQLATAIRQVAAGQMTVLLAEQHLPLAHAVADRVVVLDRGRLVFDTPAAGLHDNAVRHRLEVLLGVAAGSPAGSPG
ncbi:ATP-binding cassette domain-containing protein [Dactylosporangium fulvum]|uniref:ATP-binding cassette domain-containing protein n=1 Tax=Dactylosporangium fulvum TaxID=53359 RepID=A0ABY5VXJ1_9ACTN|nr:ATP-binding cassette domain-containing protein [Dactylosporangium fulvum]UWP82413.1 ATP-binding cassette domain-containing protein [Dactylosporangium fulvum]